MHNCSTSKQHAPNQVRVSKVCNYLLDTHVYNGSASQHSATDDSEQLLRPGRLASTGGKTEIHAHLSGGLYVNVSIRYTGFAAAGTYLRVNQPTKSAVLSTAAICMVHKAAVASFVLRLRSHIVSPPFPLACYKMQSTDRVLLPGMLLQLMHGKTDSTTRIRHGLPRQMAPHSMPAFLDLRAPRIPLRLLRPASSRSTWVNCVPSTSAALRDALH